MDEFLDILDDDPLGVSVKANTHLVEDKSIIEIVKVNISIKYFKRFAEMPKKMLYSRYDITKEIEAA